MAARYLGRLKPYTSIGISRVPCCRCGAPSVHQWQCCANGNRYMTVCVACDIAMNAAALRFVRHPHAAELMTTYRREQRLNPS